MGTSYPCGLTADAWSDCSYLQPGSHIPHMGIFDQCVLTADFGKTTLLCSLVITFFTWVFPTHVAWLLMCGEMALQCSLVITFFTWLFLTHVNWLLMFGKTILLCCLIITFLIWMFLMDWFIMWGETALLYFLVSTLITWIFLTHMYWLLMTD